MRSKALFLFKLILSYNVVMKKIIISSLLLICLFVPLISQARQKMQTYQDLKDEIYTLIDDNSLDQQAIVDFIIQQSYSYDFLNWLIDLHHSLFFNNPKGDETVYQDVMMAMAVAYDKIGQPEELISAIKRLITRRQMIWHGFRNTNHYNREYAALATLAQMTEDQRYQKFQQKLRESTNKIYLADGYPLEGPDYGLYSMKLLAPYVYFTADEEIKQGIINNLNYLASIASADKYKPAFEDSLASKLPSQISDFKEINKYWQPNFGFYNIPEGLTDNPQETVWRYDNATIWIRHRQAAADWQVLHRHFSNGDITMKQGDTWWLLAPGYSGWDNKFTTPELHNLAISKLFYPFRKLWRLLPLKLVIKESDAEEKIDKLTLNLSGKIKRVVEADEHSLVVTDSSQRVFKQFWQINGKLISREKLDNGYRYQWQQEDKILTQEITGVYQEEIKQRQHTGTVKEDIQDHLQLMVEGQNIISRFTW
ncbi:MAG: hypothetical protein AUJ28_00765 [Parcubacteria group bacterium CG1_02_37_51]|uniref:Uncharacterized protein n=2 Tax=Candidatus Komeiliibacteriota TaxID=1817908 RepID=A0A2M8DQB9_9BACT|nr:MAG: hypothetical protein AUJ28_00765 [Parcubacteria group bacterium CG1_02_37_51]PIY94983.1 MAG: hypothetical protein COY67_01685 [Candidatus Komeilibacteria bacterium CG_4_10_14_0_8_um_filter_37_78]PJC01288.1 MAG: hypothetical protein CO073_03945 [Candidatus Komeilibacteria bacterium CG_4_9_14_0_8_um_filter_36_9]